MLELFGLLLFLLQGIPESAGIIACSLALARVELRWGVILTASVILTLFIYTIRNMPLTFGLHTVASILISAVFIAKATKVPPSRSFMAVLTGFVILAMFELPFNRLQEMLLNTKLTRAVSPLQLK